MRVNIKNKQEASWKKTPDRGSMWLIELIAWIILNLGRHFARLLLYPIVTYFIIFSSTTAFSREYLTRCLRKPATNRDLFKHYYSFANMLLDRVYILAGKTSSFNITVHHEEVISELVKKNQGAILLGSHLGNFDLLRVFSSTYSSNYTTKTKALINIDNSQKINQVFERLNPSLKKDIIPLGKPDSMLLVQEFIQNGYIIGILSDRVETKKRSVNCNFLGKKTRFPTGPILLANLLKVPVIICFGLHTGKNNYDIYFIKFSDTVNLPKDKKLKQEMLEKLTQDYVNELEKHCLKTPYNWYNFYDIWADEH